MKFYAKVVSEINFPTTLHMLDLKYVWKHYDKMNKGGSKRECQWNQHYSSYFIMVNVDSSSEYVLILIIAI